MWSANKIAVDWICMFTIYRSTNIIITLYQCRVNLIYNYIPLYMFFSYKPSYNKEYPMCLPSIHISKKHIPMFAFAAYMCVLCKYILWIRIILFEIPTSNNIVLICFLLFLLWITRSSIVYKIENIFQHFLSNYSYECDDSVRFKHSHKLFRKRKIEIMQIRSS